MEKSLNENALNTCFDFPTFSAIYIRFHLMIFRLLLGLSKDNTFYTFRKGVIVFQNILKLKLWVPKSRHC